MSLASPAFAATLRFAGQVRYPVGSGLTGACDGNPATELCPIDIVNADFDGDGDRDLATANRYGAANDDVTVFLNNGKGTYDGGHDFLGGVSTFSIDVGDFNNDGKPDIVLTDPDSTPNNVVVLLNTSSGPTLSFGPPQTTPSGGSFPADVAVGRFNADSFPDLAVTNANTNDVAILLGDGDGTFTPGTPLSPPTGGFESPQGVDVGDFNRDGDPDLAVTNSAGTTVSVYLGLDGAAFDHSDDVTVGSQPGQVITADFNGDRREDIAASNYDDNTVSVALGRGDGTFRAAQSFAAGDQPFDLAVGNYNRQGGVDIAVENIGSDNVSVLLNKGAGTFSAPHNFAVGDGPFGLTSGQFNGGGGPDLATANFNSDDISVLLNRTRG
jgi:hypothetical protein